jgi:exodeoxyribonuclease-1
VSASTFFWYDLETSGIDPRWHRILQFAGVRTNEALEEISEPIAHYIKLPIDVLPDPAACLVTGLTPQLVNEKGLPELEAYVGINRIFSEPGTCVAGFNNLRFDDEFIRYSFYRHLIDPYAREWRNGNSRWDLIDLVRAAGALRPEGMEWPVEEGLPVFNLEALTSANQIAHESAHDALSDVRATLAVARLVRARQRRLWDYYLTLRDKARVKALLDWRTPEICLHVSGMIGRERSNLAPVVALAPHPTNANSVIVADLGRDVECLLRDDADSLREKLFTKGDHERPPLKEVRLNRVPFVAGLAALRRQDRARLGVDIELAERRFAALLANEPLAEKLRRIFIDERPREFVDVDAALYEGFISDADRGRCARVLTSLIAGEAPPNVRFDDSRVEPLLLRLRARRGAEVLSADDRDRWHRDVVSRLRQGVAPWVTIGGLRAAISELERSAAGSTVLRALLEHAGRIERLLNADQDPGRHHPTAN